MSGTAHPDKLPSAVLAGATIVGNECGWTPAAFREAIFAAEAYGLACLGGQFQFRLSNNICEMYWLQPIRASGSKESLGESILVVPAKKFGLVLIE